jgi:endonuclease/exonuclease/phosphatase family metal-dependent hydrolase
VADKSSVATAHKRVVAISTAALTGIACLSLPAIASAGSARVTKPSGIHLVKVSSSSFTVASKPAANARGYRMFVSTVKGNLYHGRMGAARHSMLYSSPTVSMKNLHYAATPYYYRLEAVNGTHRSFSTTIGSVGLVPGVPTNLVASSSAEGTYLTWDSGPATGYSIAVATDPTMTDGRHVYTITGLDKQFAPPDLQNGTTYYFEVAALNGTTPSAYTAAVSATVTSSQQSVSVLSYNLLEATTDGEHEGDGTIAPWSQRVVGAAALVQNAAPDVVAIQEGCAWIGPAANKVRQVDTLVNHLNGYALANTEIPPTQPHYFRTGDYILYNTAKYQAVGAGNHWSLNAPTNTHWAAYQVLQNKATGARFLFVAPHLIVGNGAALDQQREDETNSMVNQANAFVASDPMPIVYAGDFNTDINPHHAFDGPGIAMRAAGVDDSYDVAMTHTNAQYDSANEYFRTPPKFGEHIDYVFVTPGVAVTSWSLLLDLSHGKFVGAIPSDHNPLLVSVEIPY